MAKRRIETYFREEKQVMLKQNSVCQTIEDIWDYGKTDRG